VSTFIEKLVLDKIKECSRRQTSEPFLGGLGMKKVPEEIGDLTHLRRLRLEGNNLTTLPDSIGQLTQLEELDLGDNDFVILPDSISFLTKLRYLRLSRNRLIKLPEGIGELIQLKGLGLHDNQLTTLPESIGKLAELEDMRLSGNRLTTLPDSVAGLKSLHTLDLSRNCFKELPDAIGELQQLTLFYLDDNQLILLPKALRKLKYLGFLYLHGNPALNLPAEVLGPAWTEVSPPQRTATRASDILSYYFQACQGARPLNEVKLIFLGRGGAGKSSLCDRLLWDIFDKDKTETSGVAIQPWLLKCGDEPMHVHVWDFAGQEITHATHQFFLTERSIYVLVLNSRSDTQEDDAEYWLRLIQAFGRGSPVIVALNQWDRKPCEVDQAALRERFRNIRAFVECDCETRRGIDQLEEQLRNVLRDSRDVHEPFPERWWGVKERLSSPVENYFPFETYRMLCHEHGVVETDEQARLARILHALGIILHYGDDPRLRDATVLNPRWVTSGVYTLLRLKDKPGSNGTLTIDEAAAALPAEPLHMVNYLLNLMRRFDLCYPLDEEETRWLLPQVLSAFQPELGSEWNTAEAIRMRYIYDVVPEGLLPRFIVRTNPLSESSPRWRHGVVLLLDGASALVRVEPRDRRVSVVAIGEPAARLRLVKLVRGHFAQMHAVLLGFHPREELEVAGHPGVFKDIKVLERNERKHALTTVDTDDGSIQIDQTAQLNRVSAPAARDPAHPRAKLFVSYSHKDARLFDVFKTNLEVLRMDGLVSWWFDGQIRPSSEWDHAIRHELEEADIIVLMVSVAFLSRPYIRGVELSRAVQRKTAKEAEILILVLEPECPWKQKRKVKQLPKHAHSGVPTEEVEIDLSQFQALLPKNLSVQRWPMRPAAFNHVDSALRELINEVLLKKRR
jgi:internalin A